jgi:FLVCR family feline leukemia virus subgroup C receptor-related protein
MKQLCRETSSNEWGVVFQKEPPLSPSPAQATLRHEVPTSEKNLDRHAYLQTLKSLFTNRNFVLLLISYGINVGVFYVVSTLLNQIVLSHFAVSSAKTPQTII